MKAERKEELLPLVDLLSDRLGEVQVPPLHVASLKPRAGEVAGLGMGGGVPPCPKGGSRGDPTYLGIPASCVSQLTSFLTADRDLDHFRHFLDLLDQLDPITAQNQRNPRADYSVLRREVRRFLKEHPHLDADECLYVLSWVRRLIPGKARLAPAPRSEPEPSRPRRPPEAIRKSERETWQAATVSYDAGGGGVVRAVSAGRTAEARQQEARRLIDSLSQEARARMVERKKRRPITADVEVERQGRGWHLTAVREGR